MRFTPVNLAGAYVVEIEPHHDDRGFFARSWCTQEFIVHGLDSRLAQCNVSFNRKRGTLRGMHFQAAPHGEAKLVRCTRGTIHDVIVDLRPHSPTFRQWQGFELSATNHRALYIPEDFAHGFQTLEDDCEVFYQMSNAYTPSASRGLRWDDPALAISWPVTEPVLSDRDRSYALLDHA